MNFTIETKLNPEQVIEFKILINLIPYAILTFDILLYTIPFDIESKIAKKKLEEIL